MMLFLKVASTLLGMMFLFNSNVFALTFSQPIKIGEAYITPPDYFAIEGAVYHTGIPYKNKEYILSYNLGKKNGVTIFDKGIACFGKNGDELYFHYDARDGRASYQKNYFAISRFGGKDIGNTVDVTASPPGYIRMIKSNKKITLYLLSSNSQMVSFRDYEWIHTLIGKREDGKFVKFFDTKELSERFFGNPSIKNTNFSDCTVQGDTVVLKYKHISDLDRKGEYESGEFRFKWDDAAQWFGVEKVVY